MRVFPCVGAIFLCAAVSAGGLVAWKRLEPARAPERMPPVAGPAAEELRGAWVLRGAVEAARFDPARLRVVARPMGIEEAARVHFAALDPRGRFELVGLEDTDYRVEVVAIASPERVLGHAEFVRPGGDELLLALDPPRGPASDPGSLAQDP